MKSFFRTHGWFCLILLIGVFFRFFNLGVPVLASDEAEVVLASKNIFEFGVPKGLFRVPFYENAYIFESDSSMYWFEPTNYYRSDLVLRKGWLTYYISAFSLLFGDSEFILRFPFALIGVLSLFVFFKLSLFLFNKRVALIASFFYAVSPSLIFYERMIRYYSPMLLLIFCSLLFFFKAFRDYKLKDWLLGGLFFGLLFHTNIVICFSLFLVLVFMFFIQKIKFDWKLFYSGGVVFLIVVPWLFATKFFSSIVREGGVRTAPFLLSVTAGINNNGSLWFLFYISFFILLVNIFFYKKTFKKYFFWKNNFSNIFLLVFLLLMVFVPFLLAPASSFEQKLFVSIIPFSLLLVAVFVDSVMSFSKNKFFSFFVFVLILLFLVFHVETVISHRGHDRLDLDSLFSLHKNSFFVDIASLIRGRALDNPLVLTTNDHFPLLFYSNLSVQTVWPVRKSFIDNYDEEFFILDFGDGSCSFFYQYVGYEDFCGVNKNFLDRISSCENISFGSFSVYHCKARKSFVGGGLGLFFSDFPVGFPPDFIWDQHPFPLAINITNFGDSDVDGLKVVLTGEFSSRDFDSVKKEFFFDDVIPSASFDFGEIVFYNKFFFLDNLTFNFKALNKYRVINASVGVCYNYSTFLLLETCKDDAMICSFKVSGGPVLPVNVVYSGLNVSFSLSNVAEGWVGSFNNCLNRSAVKHFRVQSDSFRCLSNNGLFECSGIPSRLNPDSFYFIVISYGYQQEFKKSVLLKSRELNSYDWENFKD